MKFALSLAVYAGLGLILGAGILQAVHGSFWLLAVAGLAYLVAFLKIGCASH